ncbi:MAG: matrixin family metalloprotease [Rhizobiaceae bacterium]
MAVLNDLKWGSATPGTSGGQVTWSFATLPGAIYSFDAAISNPAYQALIRAAFDAWEAVANIDFVEVNDSAGVDIRLGWDAYDGAGGTVGEATYQYMANAAGYGTLTYAEIVFDTAETWSTDPNFVGGAQTNFFTTAVHEIGHAIGLGHSADPNAIMYFATNATINLTADDISGIRAIYGASVGGGGLTGTPGNDTLSGTAGNDVIAGLGGNDLLIGFGGNDSMSGGDGDDQLLAGSGDTGNDLLNGDAGNDTLGGGAGNDTVVGGTGGDVLFGGAGNDLLDVGILSAFTSDSASITNVAWAGAGADQVFGDNTTDTLGGGSGNDSLAGFGGNDILFGGKDAAPDTSNRDLFYGGSGDDRVYAGSDNDVLYGDVGNDTLFGGDGNDTLVGGDGNDELWGGAGNDSLIGVAGTDVFGFVAGSGSDLIADFEVGFDVLHLSGTTTNFTNSASVSAAASNTGAGLQINLGGGAVVVLGGLTTADIANMDFIF